MIPLADDTRHPRTTPIVTYSLIGLNVLVYFFLEVLFGEPFIHRWALIPSNILQGQALITLFTAMFLHAGLAHLLGNMLYLRIFGPNLEDVMGPVPYTAFYLLCGLAASAAQIAIDPASSIPNLGASGAIAGVLGGFLLEFPGDEIRVLGYSTTFTFGWSRLPAVVLIGFWFALQFFSGVGEVTSHATGEGGIAFFAHIGGFVAGLVLVKLFVTRPPTLAPRHPSARERRAAVEREESEDKPSAATNSLAPAAPASTGPEHHPAHPELPPLVWTLHPGLPAGVSDAVHESLHRQGIAVSVTNRYQDNLRFSIIGHKAVPGLVGQTVNDYTSYAISSQPFVIPEDGGFLDTILLPGEYSWSAYIPEEGEAHGVMSVHETRGVWLKFGN